MFANETASFRLPNFDGGKLKLKLETGYRVQSINQHSFGTSKVSPAQQPSSSAALIPYQIQSENLINMQIPKKNWLQALSLSFTGDNGWPKGGMVAEKGRGWPKRRVQQQQRKGSTHTQSSTNSHSK